MILVRNSWSSKCPAAEQNQAVKATMHLGQLYCPVMKVVLSKEKKRKDYTGAFRH